MRRWPSFHHPLIMSRASWWVSGEVDVMGVLWGLLLLGVLHLFLSAGEGVDFMSAFQRPASWWCHTWRRCVGRARRWTRSRSSCCSPTPCWRVSPHSDLQRNASSDGKIVSGKISCYCNKSFFFPPGKLALRDARRCMEVYKRTSAGGGQEMLSSDEAAHL